MAYDFVRKVIRMFDSSKKEYKDEVLRQSTKNNICTEVFKKMKMSNHKMKGNSLKVNSFYELVQFAHLCWHLK